MNKPIPMLKPTSTADRVASILRERLLTIEEGSYLGSEADIAEEVGISLPTLRQAARMLEYEQLLQIKPGKGGGYFARRPTIETAIKSASQYLSSKDLISDAEFLDAADPIVKRILEDAVKCKDEELLEELREFIADQRKRSKEELDPMASFKRSVPLMTLFGKMSGNILLELFARILWNEISVTKTTSNLETTQQIARKNHSTRLKVAEAVLERDLDKALKAWERRSKFLRSWPQRGFSLRGGQKAQAR